MKTLIRMWLSGWVIAVCLGWFLFVVAVLLIPVHLIGWALGVEDLIFMDGEGLHVQKLIVFLMTMVLLPFAFYFAAEKTRYFDRNRVQKAALSAARHSAVELPDPLC